MRNRVVTGIVESHQTTLRTYEVQLNPQQMKPTLNLFTHDPSSRTKLSGFIVSVTIAVLTLFDIDAAYVFMFSFNLMVRAA